MAAAAAPARRPPRSIRRVAFWRRGAAPSSWSERRHLRPRSASWRRAGARASRTRSWPARVSMTPPSPTDRDGIRLGVARQYCGQLARAGALPGGGDSSRSARHRRLPAKRRGSPDNVLYPGWRGLGADPGSLQRFRARARACRRHVLTAFATKPEHRARDRITLHSSARRGVVHRKAIRADGRGLRRRHRPARGDRGARPRLHRRRAVAYDRSGPRARGRCRRRPGPAAAVRRAASGATPGIGRSRSRPSPSACRRRLGRPSPGAKARRGGSPRASPGCGCGPRIAMRGSRRPGRRNGC